MLYNELLKDSILYSGSDTSLSQLDMQKEVNTDAYLDCINVFAEVIPYEIVTNIFNQNTYIWNEQFISKVLVVLQSGLYNNGLTLKEKELIKRYVDYKYNGTEEPDEVLISLDNFIGAM